MAIFYDKFTNEYTKEKNIYAAPERYYEVIPYSKNFFVERWVMDDMTYRNVYYSKEHFNYDYVNALRDTVFCGLEPLYITEYSVPIDVYEEIEKMVE